MLEFSKSSSIGIIAYFTPLSQYIDPVVEDFLFFGLTTSYIFKCDMLYLFHDAEGFPLELRNFRQQISACVSDLFDQLLVESIASLLVQGDAKFSLARLHSEWMPNYKN